MNIKRNLGFIIVTILLVAYWSIQLVRFNKGSYIIYDKDLVRIDSIKTLTKAFKEPHGKGSAGSYDLLFKDITGKEFRYSVLMPLNFC